MNNVVNSILNGFSSILALDQGFSSTADDGCACSSGSGSGGCCKDQPKKEEKKIDTGCACGSETPCSDGPTEIDTVKLVYASLTGTAKTFATELETKLKEQTNVKIQHLNVVDITEYDNDDLLTETAVCVFILSSYNVEGPLDW